MIYKADDACSLCLPAGSEIPNWFSPQTTGSSISFHAPSFWDGKMGKMLLCVVFAAKKEAHLSRVGCFNWRLRNKTRTHQMGFTIGSKPDRFFGSCEDHIFVQKTGDYQPFGFEVKSGDEIELFVKLASISMDRSEELEGEIQVKKCGIHLLGNEPSVTDTRGDKTVITYSEYRIYSEYILKIS